MIPFDPSEGFPPVDTGGLRAVAAWLTGAAGKMSSESQAVANLASSVQAGGAAWTGAAADAWEVAGRQRSGWYQQAGATWEQVAGVLSNVADQLDQARAAYVQANESAMTAMGQARDLTAAATADAAHPNANLLAQASAATQEMQASTGAAAQALAQASAAVQAAAGSLGPLTDAATKCCPQPMTPGQYKGQSLEPSRQWVIMLFGSVVGNRIAGRAFQNEVLRDLGIDENTTSYTVTLPGGLSYTTIPDGDENTLLIEVKGVGYLSGSKQLTAEIQVARANGQEINVVVQPRTQVSRPLQEDIERAGGNIKVRVGNNAYRGYDDKSDDPTMYRGNGKGGWEKVNEREPEAGDPGDQPTSGNANDGGGGDDGGGSDDGGGVTPEDPGDPGLPEPDIFDFLP